MIAKPFQNRYSSLFQISFPIPSANRRSYCYLFKSVELTQVDSLHSSRLQPLKIFAFRLVTRAFLFALIHNAVLLAPMNASLDHVSR
jgi:hypothetical protein